MYSVKDVMFLSCEGKRINVSSLSAENCSGEFVKKEYSDGFELKPDTPSIERIFVTDKGLVIKVLKKNFLNKK